MNLIRSFTLRIIIPWSARVCQLPVRPFTRNYLFFSWANNEHIWCSIFTVASVNSVIFDRALLDISLSFRTVDPANDVVNRFRQGSIFARHVSSVRLLVAYKQVPTEAHLPTCPLSKAFSIFASQSEDATVLTEATPVYSPVSIICSLLDISKWSIKIPKTINNSSHIEELEQIQYPLPNVNSSMTPMRGFDFPTANPGGNLGYFQKQYDNTVCSH